MKKTPRLQIPTSFLIALLIFGVIQILVFEKFKNAPCKEGADQLFNPSDRLPGIEETVIAWQLQNINASRERPDIIVLGDSSCLVGVNPLVMEKNLGMKVLNMGTIGWLMPEGHTDLLRAFIKANGAPKLVIYHMSEELMQLEQKDIDASGFLYRLHLALGLEKKKAEFFDFLPTYKYREDLRKLRSKKKTSGFRDMPRGVWPSASDMFAELSRTKGQISDPTPGIYEFKPGHTFANHESIFTRFSALAQIGEEYGFKIYFVFSPLPSDILNHYPKEFDELANIIRTHLRGYPDFILREPIFVGLENKYFQTQYSHLNAAGTELNTQNLIREIKTLGLEKVVDF